MLLTASRRGVGELECTNRMDKYSRSRKAVRAPPAVVDGQLSSKHGSADAHASVRAVAQEPRPREAQGEDDEEERHRLRMFDLDPHYGPFVGVSRMERWKRAKTFGLEPPDDVLRIIERGQYHDVADMMGQNLQATNKRAKKTG
ncbi:DNA polymerase delta subunit 4 [Porphyridium purpureum]|uniref:DNA polymerase delta subunit 4 n=1 Tax=Porphyridium purpureum TaxID=35688 RepID=A0A5J4YVB8_PORPP|nr:DNA polymerase delta subunit 4 [Porphyridium purpureum]|eukprot:POR4947..scf229_5